MTSIEQVIGHSQHKSVLSRVLNIQAFWVFMAAILACLALTSLLACAPPYETDTSNPATSGTYGPLVDGDIITIPESLF